MAKKFVAEKPDLVLELTTLTGEEVTLEPTNVVSGQVALEITKKWTELEASSKKKEVDISPVEVITTELGYIYPKESEWFLKNFDLATLNEILTYVAQTIGGIKKKSKK